MRLNNMTHLVRLSQTTIDTLAIWRGKLVLVVGPNLGVGKIRSKIMPKPLSKNITNKEKHEVQAKQKPKDWRIRRAHYRVTDKIMYKFMSNKRSRDLLKMKFFSDNILGQQIYLVSYTGRLHFSPKSIPGKCRSTFSQRNNSHWVLPSWLSHSIK